MILAHCWLVEVIKTLNDGEAILENPVYLWKLCDKGGSNWTGVEIGLFITER